ncbi:MAG: hypothetical protein K0Q79_3167 [Flavipsychrobacter sp.]|jgi:hypothetical protein|nr:hypothetical protein [Flavipsychrobacter sp.]
MKNILSFFLILFSAATYAQPMLTAATSNPMAGEIFTINLCNAAGVLPGAAGATVTWDFHTLTTTFSYSYNFVTCTSTSYCDSFPASNLASYVGAGSSPNYYYYSTNTTAWEVLGQYSSLGYYTYYYKPEALHRYPVVYNASFLDTFIDHASGSISYDIVRDSVKIDGYGTLILPSGTFTNVLRQHVKSVQYDSSVSSGVVSYSTTREVYRWYMPGYHFMLLQVYLDSSSGSGMSVTSVLYTTSATLGIATVNNNELSPEISPNPASDVLYIKFAAEGEENMVITLTDITGKIVGNTISAKTAKGANDIQYPITGMPPGLYLLNIADGTHNITKKVVITGF